MLVLISGNGATKYSAFSFIYMGLMSAIVSDVAPALSLEGGEKSNFAGILDDLPVEDLVEKHADRSTGSSAIITFFMQKRFLVSIKIFKCSNILLHLNGNIFPLWIREALESRISQSVWRKSSANPRRQEIGATRICGRGRS
jgi:hypothetical protein